MKTPIIMKLVGAAALVATAFAAPSMEDAARIEKFGDLLERNLIKQDDYNKILSDILGDSMKATESAPRRQLQDNSDVAQSKCLASMMADTADMAQECMDGIRTATNPAVTGIIQFLADNLEIPACPECPSMVMSGDGNFAPCGALPIRYDQLPITHNCPTEYPFMKAGTGCNAQCTNGPERFDFYCPPDNNQAMQAPIAVIPQWAVDDGFDAWMPRCCAAQPDCSNFHDGYKCASDMIDLVMCFEARDGYFVQENFVTNACADVCVTCWGSSDKRCVGCYDGYYYDTDIINFPQTSQYLHESEEGDYTYATCTRCDGSCHTCDGPGAENCLHRVCHDDYCQGDNMVLVDGWEDIMCHRDDCEMLQNGRRAMVQQNDHRSLQSGEESCCVERAPCDLNACDQPQYELFRDGSHEGVLCAGPECQYEVDNAACCELAFEACNERACYNLWYPRQDFAQRWCESYPCEPQYDNEHCCTMAAWLDYGHETSRIQGKTMYMSQSDWDGGRMSEWYTTGHYSMTVHFDYDNAGGTSSMMGALRRYGVAYWSHFHSDNPNDGHPDGYGFYSDQGPYSWYGGASWHHIDGCCYGWQNQDYIRMEMDIDELWLKWYTTRPGDESLRDRHWGTATSMDCQHGCAFGITPHDHDQRITLIDDEVYKVTGDPADYLSFQIFDDRATRLFEYEHYDGHILDWGGADAHEDRVDWDCDGRGDGHVYTNPDGSDISCRDRKTITHWQHGRWWSYRTSMWKTDGYSSQTYYINYMYQLWMFGVIRGDYVRYYNHPHSGSVSDEHPEGWVWYSSNGGFDNYAPYGGNFYHDRSDIGGFQTDELLRVDYDLRAGQNPTISIYIFSESRGYNWDRVCRWTDIDIGVNGIAFGGAMHDGQNSGVGNSMTIMETYWNEEMSYDEMLASGSDLAHAAGSGVDGDGRRALIEDVRMERTNQLLGKQ